MYGNKNGSFALETAKRSYDQHLGIFIEEINRRLKDFVFWLNFSFDK
jgi:hypothetical protein